MNLANEEEDGQKGLSSFNEHPLCAKFHVWLLVGYKNTRVNVLVLGSILYDERVKTSYK